MITGQSISTSVVFAVSIVTLYTLFNFILYGIYIYISYLRHSYTINLMRFNIAFSYNINSLQNVLHRANDLAMINTAGNFFTMPDTSYNLKEFTDIHIEALKREVKTVESWNSQYNSIIDDMVSSSDVASNINTANITVRKGTSDESFGLINSYK